MAGVINAASKGSYTDSTGQSWIYYQDQDTNAVFYIMPKPVMVQNQDGSPQFSLTEYTDNQGNFVAGSCKIITELAPVSSDVQTAVAGILRNSGIANPTYQAMPFLDSTPSGSPDPNCASLKFSDAAGTVSRTITVVPSLSTAGVVEEAIFNITSMTRAEVQFFKNYFGGNAEAGTVEITYQLTATAAMGGIQVQVTFDAQAAFEYQRTYAWV